MITAGLSALVVALLASIGMPPTPATVVAIVVVIKCLVVATLGIFGARWYQKQRQ